MTSREYSQKLFDELSECLVLPEHRSRVLHHAEQELQG